MITVPTNYEKLSQALSELSEWAKAHSLDASASDLVKAASSARFVSVKIKLEPTLPSQDKSLQKLDGNLSHIIDAAIAVAEKIKVAEASKKFARDTRDSGQIFFHEIMEVPQKISGVLKALDTVHQWAREANPNETNDMDKKIKCLGELLDKPNRKNLDAGEKSPAKVELGAVISQPKKYHNSTQPGKTRPFNAMDWYAKSDQGID